MLRDLAVVYARVLSGFGISFGCLAAFVVPIYPPARGPAFLFVAALTACGAVGGRSTRRPALVFAVLFLAFALLSFWQGQRYERLMEAP